MYLTFTVLPTVYFTERRYIRLNGECGLHIMNIAACAAGAACAAALVTGIAGVAPGLTDGLDLDASFFIPRAALTAQEIRNADGTVSCDPGLVCETTTSAPAEDPATVYVLPEPTGDAKKDFKTLQAAIDDKRYAVIDGAKGSDRQVYTIDGMLEVTRTLKIRNLELHQQDHDTVVRTIYAAGGIVPITLALENIKIERGPSGSEATGSVSDSAGIWTTGVTPQFKNIEIYGGGKGDGVLIVNADGGYLTDVYVHDITWTPYQQDQDDSGFWEKYTLSTLQKSGNWNGFTIHDYDGHGFVSKRIEEQVNGIVLDNVNNIAVTRPRVERLQTRFSDGQVYPYQTDGLTIVSGNNISIQGANISHVAEGIDVPGFPARAITISNSNVSDAPIFCFKTRGSYDARSVSLAEGSQHVTVTGSTATRCGMAAFSVAGGAEAWLQDTQAIDTGLGPDGTATPGIGTVAAYRFFKSSTLPNLDASSAVMGMHIRNAKVSNPNSRYMSAAFHSENSPSDRRTYAGVRDYDISNPTKPDVKVSTNFTEVVNTPAPAPTTTATATATATADTSGDQPAATPAETPG